MNTFKIKCTFLFWITAFLCMITGLFHEFLLFMSLILVHECGHAFMAFLCHWKVDKIMIYPFGGITLFNEKINRSMKEELMILLMGPLTQVFYHWTLCSFFSPPPIFTFYHHALLLFNLLPIYPLDGGRIFFLVYQTFFPYLLSHKIMITSSFFLFFFLFFFFLFKSCSHFFLLSFFFLFFKLLKEKKQEPYVFQKFLLERLLYDFSFPFQKKIKGKKIHKMYRDHTHFFYVQNHLIEEREILRKKFDL